MSIKTNTFRRSREFAVNLESSLADWGKNLSSDMGFINVELLEICDVTEN
jgi:hypothetical protein